MIRFLSIRNLAIVEGVEMEFEPGFNVLTGETGAGKSILVEAVGLLVGGRASPDLVRTGADLAQVQAIFETHQGRELVIRREISAQGRSRAFIDDALAPAATLKAIGAELVELHGQHEHQVLLDPASHLDLIDQFARLHSERGSVAERFEAWRMLRAELDRAQLDDRERTARVDLLAFQATEISQVAPKPQEDEELAAARLVLANAERLRRLCAESYADLYEDDHAVLARLASVWRRIGDLAALEPGFVPYRDARDGIKSQLEDLAAFLRGYAETLDASPERLQQIEDRLARLERLKRKYGPTLADVVARKLAAERELEELTGSAARASELEKRLSEAGGRFVEAARGLSTRRREAAVDLSRQLEGLCGQLAMEHTRCEVRFADELTEGLWSAAGIDQAEFYLSPNPGEELRPLARIASGGELSRLMLALRTLSALDRPGRTLIFDEVDAGIGGRVADAVGSRLRQLGSRFQVLCITHLPQIAVYAPTHFRIVKDVRDGRTSTRVERLAVEDRVDEVARMIGGAGVSEQVRASAREMIERQQATTPGIESKTKGESERAKTKRSRA